MNMKAILKYSFARLCSLALFLPGLELSAGAQSAPVITTQPVGQIVAIGQPVTLSVAANPPPTTYQWMKDGALLVGQTNATLSLPAFQFINSGNYRVVVADAAGMAVSLPAALSITNSSAYGWGDNNGNSQLPAVFGITNTPVQVNTNIVQIALSSGTTLYVRSDLTLWAQGRNDVGQFGNGGTGNSATPVLVSSNVLTAAAGGGASSTSSFFIKTDGTLWAMGFNTSGQLGIGTTANAYTPVFVSSNVSSVAAGSGQTLFVKQDGTLWGMGRAMAINRGNTNRPVYITNNVVTAVEGLSDALFIKADSTLWGMGANTYGEITFRLSGTTNRPVFWASNVVAVGICSAVSSDSSVYAVKADGTLWSAGGNNYGQLGNNSTNNSTTPVFVSSNNVNVAGGYYFGHAIKADGSLWAWGYNDANYVELGVGNNVPQTNYPVPVPGALVASLPPPTYATVTAAIMAYVPVVTLASQNVVAGQPFTLTPSISRGTGPFTCQWSCNGTNLPGATNLVYAVATTTTASAGAYTITVTGPPGLPGTATASINIITPPSQATVPGQSVTLTVAAGLPSTFQWLKDGVILTGQTNTSLVIPALQFTNAGTYQIAVSNAGGLQLSQPEPVAFPNASLFGWGNNSYGQLANGTNGNNFYVPTLLTNGVVAAAAGDNHSLYLDTNNTLWAVGQDNYGQLGIGVVANYYSTPVLVASNVVSLSGDQDYTLFVKADGTLWAVGYNQYGALGNGTSGTSYSTPVYVTNNVVLASAGYTHALFVKADGTLWAMGEGGDGELGIGSNTNCVSPEYVTNNVIIASAGTHSSFFVKADGTLWDMGYNSDGQLGLGNDTSVNVPTYVTSNVVSASAGVNHFLYLKADGTLWGTGNNIFGDLGVGNNITFNNTPQLILTNVAAMAGGNELTTCVKTDGTVWSTGYNPYGELGIGTSGSTNVFVQVPGIQAAQLAQNSRANHMLALAGYLPAFTLTNQSIVLGQSLILIPNLTNGTGPFTCQWSFNGANLPGATNFTYSVAAVSTNDVGVYSLTINSLYGPGSASASVIVTPVITAQPVGQIVGIGQPVTLTVAANPAPTAYQWMKDGALLVGQTNATFSLPSFQFINSGNYQVVVYDAAGIAVSLPAALSVTNAPAYGWGQDLYHQLGTGFSITNAPALINSNVVQIALSLGTTFWVKSDLTLWAQGRNNYGQLGNGGTTDSTTPVFVSSNVLSAAAGGGVSACFIKTDGTLWAMGGNAIGQLGIGTTNPAYTPVLVSSNVSSVAVGGRSTLLVKQDGTLWYMGMAWGTAPNYTPAYITNNVVTAIAGINDTLFIKADSTLWGMGGNVYGEITFSLAGGTYFPSLWASNVVAASISAVASEDSSVYAILADGTLWSAGENNYGQLGNNNTVNSATPVFVSSNNVNVAGGYNSSHAIKADGSLWAWGLNAGGYYDLGAGNNVSQTNHPVPVPRALVASLPPATISSVAAAIMAYVPVISLASQDVVAGQPFTLTPKVTGGTGPFTYQWSRNGTNLPGATNLVYSGAATTTTSADVYTVTVNGPTGPTTTAAVVNVTPASQVALLGQSVTLAATAGAPSTYQWLKDGVILTGQTNASITFNALAFTNCGNYQVAISNAYGLLISLPASLSVPNQSLEAWGYNNVGQLGNLPVTSTNRPVFLTNNIVAASIGQNFSLYVRSDHTLWGMGYNAQGELGIGNANNSAVPVFIASNVVAVAAGYSHSLILKLDGTLWAVGYNNYGQLGVGNTTTYYTPVYVTNNVAAIAAGQYHSLVLRMNGTLWGMGYNGQGQLGLGSGLNSTNVPGFVTNNVLTIAAGYNHSLYVRPDGTLWTMGMNSYGQLGNGNTSTVYYPTMVASGVATAAGGQYHSLYLTTTGNLWAMGYNTYGQLGNGNYNNASSPVFITGNVVAAVATYYNSVLAKSDGSLWTMGDNTYGELGNGTPFSLSKTNVPVLVTGAGQFTTTLAPGSAAEHSLVISLNTNGSYYPILPPVANPLTVTRSAGLTLKIALADLASNWSDPYGIPVKLIAITPVSTNGATVYPLNLTTNQDGSYVLGPYAFLGYAGTNNVNDQLRYTISDGGGDTNIGYINIVVSTSPLFGQISGQLNPNGSALTLNFTGQPGYPYSVQRSTNLTSWVTIWTTNAPAGSQFNYTDNYSDLGGLAPSAAYYRLAWVP